MGSRARAREGDEAVPGADDFWGEGAAAVHGAIQPAARQTDAPAAAPPVRVRGHRPRARRAWGFSVSPAPRRGLTARVPVRPRIAAIAVVVMCLVAAAAIGLTEGGGRPPNVGRSTVARGSAGSHPLEPTAGGLPAAGFLNTAWVARAEVSTTKAREQAAARARANRRRLARRAARRRRREAAEHHSSTRSTNAPASSSNSQESSTSTTPMETTTQSVAPTTTPAATSASGAGSSSTHATSTHRSAFGQTGLLGAGHSSGDS